MGYGIFGGNEGLTYLVIPGSVKSIVDFAFDGNHLTGVEIQT